MRSKAPDRAMALLHVAAHAGQHPVPVLHVQLQVRAVIDDSSTSGFLVEIKHKSEDTDGMDSSRRGVGIATISVPLGR